MSLRGIYVGVLLLLAAAVGAAPTGGYLGAALTIVGGGPVYGRILADPAPPGGRWHPSAIPGCHTWEAGDVAHISQSAGLVGMWADTRGAYSLAASGAARPTLSGGRMVFDGSTSLVGTGPAAGSAAIRLMLVGSLGSSSGEDLPLIAGTPNSADSVRRVRALYRSSGSTLIAGATWANDWVSTLGWGLGEVHVAAAQFGATGTTAVSIGRDGTYQTSSLGAATLAPSATITIGGSPTYGSVLSLSAAAVCVGDLAQADVDRLDGWAAWLLGIQGSLPAGHPYRAARP